MRQRGNMKVGVGFATGRKSFQKVLRTYIHSWKESGLVDDSAVSLNLFVAYDLHYQNTQVSDYTDINQELSSQIESRRFIGGPSQQKEIDSLVARGILGADEAALAFGKGYAGRRNSVVYSAIKAGMDYLIFLDDDEYPLAVTNTRNMAVWSGQHVLSTHLDHIGGADITHGHHCGYISPIPYVEFDRNMAEDDFRRFIEVISNDIISWDKIRKVMGDGGVTYADTSVLTDDSASEVPEINGAKFISGANLCLNLTKPDRVFPFFNPPLARGEDTFLSTCLSERKVLRVPCYTFHDGFSTYNHLLEGVLPIHLNFVRADSEKIIDRFYKACIGWVRYKPLLLYITKPGQYSQRILEMKDALMKALPKVGRFFNRPDFSEIAHELDKYDRNVRRHNEQFLNTKRAWSKLMGYLESRRLGSGPEANS